MSRQMDLVRATNVLNDFLMKVQKHTGKSAQECMQDILQRMDEVFPAEEAPKTALESARAKAQAKAQAKAIPDWEEKGKCSAWYGVRLSREELVALYKAGERNFAGADLRGATNLAWVNLCDANLSGVNLCGVELYSANLSGTNLSGTNLSGTNLSGTNLHWADLEGANLEGVQGLWKAMSLENAKNLTQEQLDSVELASAGEIEEMIAMLKRLPTTAG